MSDYVKGSEREQVILLPDRLDDYVDENNPVRFIDAFVDSLDLVKLGFKHAEPNEDGRPPYNPSDLLKLYIWGYLNQIRSSRKLERECHRDFEVVWLMKRLAPDFKTIANFRKDNIDHVKPVFKEFVFLCRGLDLFGAELISVDSCKLRAVNSKERNFTRDKLIDRLKRINYNIERYLRELGENDEKEREGRDDSRGERVKLLAEKLEKIEERKNEYERLLAKMNESGLEEISLTDPDSRLMVSNNRLEVSYNTQTAVDSKEKLIVDYDVTNEPIDRKQLSPIAKSAKEALGAEHIDATADRGYHYGEEIKECIDNGITPYVSEPLPSVNKKAGIPKPEFYNDKFVYDKTADAYICPAGQRLEPWYKTVNRRGKRITIYRTKACFTCPFFMTKCTRNRRGRAIERWEHEEILEEMRARMRSIEGMKKFQKRMELSEHPFGTIKRAFNQGYLLLRGLRKVRGEVGFTMLAYDMRRVINILGVKTLIASVR